MKKACCVALLLAACLNLAAQSLVRGTVTNAATREPVEAATVSLLSGGREKFAGYAITNARGEFSIRCDARVDSLQLSVSLLGYETWKRPVGPGEQVDARLSEQVFRLREVTVKPGRVWGRRDTVNYDVSRFITPQDESIKDVIKKLPGLDVSESGQVSYNGKPVNKFYVEGMDLTGGRYNQISNNLQARAVSAVQVLDNHQPVRLLQDKINTEDVAINLKLRPEFRDKWMVNLRAGAGTADHGLSGDALWEGDLNALQLSRKSQSAYVYKGNNTGTDISSEQELLTFSALPRWREPLASPLLSQPSLLAPLRTERLLFNNMHALSGNRLRRLDDTRQLRVNAGYARDMRQQLRGSETSYFRQRDTLRISEQSHTRIRSDKADLGLYFEENAPARFLTNQFSASGAWGKGVSRFTPDGGETIRQQIDTRDISLENKLKSLRMREGYTLEFQSSAVYKHLPSELRNGAERQRLPVNYLYANHSLAFLKKKGYLTRRYTLGTTAEVNNLQNSFNASFTPLWQYHPGKWRSTLSIPVVWTSFPGNNFSRPAANPTLSLFYQYSYAWRFSFNALYRERYGGVSDFYLSPYRTNYRHTVQREGGVPVQRTQAYAVYGEYKNVIREFFASLGVSHRREWSSHTPEQLAGTDMITSVFRKRSSASSGWTVNGTLSKGFFDLGLKTSLTFLLNSYRSEQLRDGQRTPVRSCHALLEPKVNWSAANGMEAAYTASFRYGGNRIGSASLDPLWNIVQRLNLAYTFGSVTLGCGADHYYNDVSSEKGVHLFLPDASARWKRGRWQLEAAATNLLNKKLYEYTLYSALQSYTSRVSIRGREIKVSARYRF